MVPGWILAVAAGAHGAAVACGADGLIVEVHEDPEHALSDGAQTLTPAMVKRMLAECGRVAEAVDRTM